MTETQIQTHPFLTETFPYNWSNLTPEHIVSDGKEAIRMAQEKVNKIKEVPIENSTFENIIEALEFCNEHLSKFSRLNLVLRSFRGDVKEYNQQYQLISPEISDFYTSMTTDLELFKRVEYVYNHMNDENVSMDDDMKRLTSETYFDYLESGCQLSDEEKEKFKEIKKELIKTTQDYAKNSVDGQDKEYLLITDEKELEGIPEVNKNMYKKEAEKSNLEGWKISIQSTMYIPVMKYCKNVELRKKLYLLSNQVCTSGEFDNSENVKKILKLRQEYVKMLKFNDFSDYTTSRRMARNGKNALDFVEGLHEKVKPFFEKDIETIRQMKKEVHNEHNDPDEVLHQWDLTYYTNLIRQKEYQYDPEDFRKYLPEKKVMKGLFEMYHRLYGVTFTLNEEVKGWHDDVKFYDIFDEDGTHLGGVYFDIFPRAGKRQGAWEGHLRELRSERKDDKRENDRHKKYAYIGANLRQPIDGEASFTLGEVETLFHESGHLMHDIFAFNKYPSLSSGCVPWDFIELPSQVMENWIFERETLDLITGTNEDERIPDELFQKVVSAKNFMSGNYLMGQLKFGKMDLELHRSYLLQHEENDIDPDTFVKQVTKEYSVEYPDESYSHLMTFGHLFNSMVGYAAGYYSYMWAKSIDADAFEFIKEKGIFNREISMKFRKEVLEMGNRKPVDELYRNFRGRDPDLDALLKQYGLL